MGRRLRAVLLSDLGVMVIVLAIFAAVGVSWDLHWRHHQPFDVDESGYLNIALADVHRLLSGGIVGWVKQVDSPSQWSPITTALATPIFLVFGAKGITALLVPLCLMMAAGVLTFLAARRFMSRAAAWIATILFLTCPAIIDFSRDFIFVAAATCVMSLALYCYGRSDHLHSLRWTLLTGVAVGLLPLARTMAIAYMPAFAVLGLLDLLIEREDRPARIRNAALAVVAAAAVMTAWLLPNHNYKLVWNYLTSYGYGKESKYYGETHKHRALSWALWKATADNFARSVHLPYFLVYLFGALAALIAALRTVSRPVGSWLRAATRHPVFPFALSALIGFIALSSSNNAGDGFAVPLVGALCVITGWIVDALIRRAPATLKHWGVPAAWGPVGVVACFALLPALPWAWSLDSPWVASVPILGDTTVASGQGIIEQYEVAGRPVNNMDSKQLKEGSQWVAANWALANRVKKFEQQPAMVAFLFWHRMVNLNSANLVLSLANQPTYPITAVPLTIGTSENSVFRWLTKGVAAYACVALTANGRHDHFNPTVSPATQVAVVRRAGFVPLTSWSLPDKRVVTLWRRDSTCPPDATRVKLPGTVAG